MPTGKSWACRCCLAVAVLLQAGPLAGVGWASDLRLYDDGELAVWGRGTLGGVGEPAVPTYVNGQYSGNYQGLESYDKVPGVSSWPLTMVDLIANTYLRTTYQNADGSGASLGTSIVGTVSFRTPAGLQYVPTLLRSDVVFGGADRLRTSLSGQFGSMAAVGATCTFPNPPVGLTTIGLTTQFQANQNISLSPGQMGNDAFRLGGLSSMFASPSQFDANIVRWRGADGVVHEMPLTGATARDSYLFAAPKEIAVGGYFELVKARGSTWYPSSPSVRVNLTGLSGLSGRVGIQGYLAGTTNPNDDSLGVWLEWLDAPATILSGAAYQATFSVVADPPSTAADLNGDGIVNAADIDLLYAHTGANPQYDLTGDGLVNHADVDVLVHTILGTAYGDATLDGVVDGLDFQRLLNNWNAPGTFGWADGNFNGDIDGQVEGLDFQVLLNNWGFGIGGGSIGSVPEPASATLLLFGAVGLLRRRR